MPLPRAVSTSLLLLAFVAPGVHAAQPGCNGTTDNYFCDATVQREVARAKKAFLPVKLAVHQSVAGALLCAPGACTDLPRPVLHANEPNWSAHEIRLSRAGATYVAFCDEGPSGDPNCRLAIRSASAGTVPLPDDASWRSQRLSGEVFVAPGDGCLYIAQTTDTAYPRHEKVCPDSAGMLQYAEAGFLHVGFQSRTQAALVLLGKPQAGATSVHTIPAGRFVEVLVGLRPSGDEPTSWYLVRDAFGITGWWAPEPSTSGPCPSSPGDGPIAGFCYNGD